jgi:hypothetical protein
MPEDFSIVVRGHVGWDKTFEQRAKYALVISFDVLSREMEIFNDIRIALQEVEVQPVEVEVGVDI